MKSIIRSAFALAITVPLAFAATAACAQQKAPTDDIVDTAVKAAQFNTLVAAVKAAGLVDTLKGRGPFTVFAPNDAAFAKLPKSIIAELLKPENKGALTQILTYHVVAGSVGEKTAEGSEAAIVPASIEGAKVIRAGIQTTNGVIHVIDNVILPPKLRGSATEAIKAERAKEKGAKKH